jgi:hypothetical protein
MLLKGRALARAVVEAAGGDPSADPLLPDA